MPRLLLDREKCLRNMERMVRVAGEHRLSLRPHSKTHQSLEISNWFRDFGVSAITVSSFEMARYFAMGGWQDILVAFPFHPGELDQLRGLSGNITLSILVDTPAALPFLNHLEHPVGFYVDIDTGYGRTGIRAENTELIDEILLKAGANSRLSFRGFYCHAGHSYKTSKQKEREAIHQKARADLERLKEQYREHHPRVLYGDTPNCSTQNDFRGIDEITPGNFVFYDLIQHRLGACNLEDIAVALECPVAGKYHHHRQLVVHGGAVHFSKEALEVEGKPGYGRLVHADEGGWVLPARTAWITQISQEHGVMEDCGDLFSRVSIGDRLLFLPVHSCLTANLAREYITLDGHVIDNIHSVRSKS